MPVRHEERARSLGQLSLSALLAFALLAAGLLSVSPALHEHLHPDTATIHFCVVTLFASGQCEGATAAPVAAALDAPPLLATLPLADSPARPRARFFLLLEHAPPSFA